MDEAEIPVTPISEKLEKRIGKLVKPDEIHKQVTETQEHRSPHAIIMDRARLAHNVVKRGDRRKWLGHPNRYDIRGVDTPKQIKTGRGKSRG